MKNKIITILALLGLIVASCKKPYDPPAVTATTNYLVVEGLIATGSDTTTISLSRTIKLDSNTIAKPELRATVSVQDDNNVNYPLPELGNGKYTAFLNLDNTKKYRVHIKTSDGKEYASDYSASVNTPDIDSIPYKVTSTGVQFYVNTHDPANATHYYRWSFEETWAYVSYYYSYYIFTNGQILGRSNYYLLYTCYKTAYSQQVLIGSSAKLAQDVINLQPINMVVPASGKLSHGYSFLLKQYGLTQAAYSYWDNLKKNTESLGSIFDAQPSTLIGNLTCITNPQTSVLGFISVSTVKYHRVFIDPINLSLYLPPYFSPPNDDDCARKFISLSPLNTFSQRASDLFAKGDYIPILDGGFNGIISGYYYAPKECVDCRLKPPYGTNVKPPFFK